VSHIPHPPTARPDTAWDIDTLLKLYNIALTASDFSICDILTEYVRALLPINLDIFEPDKEYELPLSLEDINALGRAANEPVVNFWADVLAYYLLGGEATNHEDLESELSAIDPVLVYAVMGRSFQEVKGRLVVDDPSVVCPEYHHCCHSGKTMCYIAELSRAKLKHEKVHELKKTLNFFSDLQNEIQFLVPKGRLPSPRDIARYSQAFARKASVTKCHLAVGPMVQHARKKARRDPNSGRETLEEANYPIDKSSSLRDLVVQVAEDVRGVKAILDWELDGLREKFADTVKGDAELFYQPP
jgi:hypothetical protein